MEKKNQRKISLIIISIFITLSLISCDLLESNTEQTQKVKESEIVTIEKVTVIPFNDSITFTKGNPVNYNTTSTKPYEVTLTIPYAMATTEFTNFQAASVFNWALNQSYSSLKMNSSETDLLWDEEKLYHFGGNNQLEYSSRVITVTEGYDNYPCTNLTYNGMKMLCYFLNDIYDYEQSYDPSNDFSTNHTAEGWRLPTEAEWEFAAKGGKKLTLTTYSGSNVLDDVAWTQENCKSSGVNSQFTSGLGTNPVKQKEPNEIGIYDMSGNIAEMTNTWHDTYNTTPQTNPTGPDTGSIAIYKGGSWLKIADSGYTVYRVDLISAGSYGASIGFRPILVLNN